MYAYDNAGNPLTFGCRSYTWEHGRQLASINAWSFTYDADGMRTSRSNGTKTYSYVYNGSSLSQMTVVTETTENGETTTTTDTLYFTYDASGTPQTVTYNDTVYYYATNLQGDVTAILNSNGTAVVEYTYDAWGKLLTTTGSMASNLGVHNPLRYRGYVYDSETGLYYLQSRYYNAGLGRFNAPDSFVSTGQGILGNNMFAYCNNNPANCIDYSGTFPCTVRCLADLAIGSLGNYNEVDLTSKLTSFMTENAKILQDYYDTHGFIKAAFFFIGNVTDKGILDIKLQDEWQFEEGTKYYFNGVELRYDDPGNINFGYVGAVLFPEDFLCFGAGLNQISKFGFAFGDISTFYDDPRDNEMIKLGFALYWENIK